MELKAEGEKPRPLQASVHRILTGLGFHVYVIDSKSGVKAYVNEISEEVGEPE